DETPLPPAVVEPQAQPIATPKPDPETHDSPTPPPTTREPFRVTSAFIRDTGHTEPMIYAIDVDGTIRITSLSTSTPPLILQSLAHTRSILCLQLIRHATALVSASADGSLILWDLDTQLPTSTIRWAHDAPIHDLACFEVDGVWRVVTGGREGVVKVWEVVEDAFFWRREMVGHEKAINGVAVCPTRGWVASGSGDASVKVWEWETGVQVRTLVGHLKGVACVDFVGDEFVVSGSNDAIRVWRVETGECVRVLEGGHVDFVRCLKVREGKVVSGSYDCKICVWDFETGELEAKLHGHFEWVLDLYVDTHRILSCGAAERLIEWNLGDVSSGVGSPLVNVASAHEVYESCKCNTRGEMYAIERAGEDGNSKGDTLV
ncbi:protein with putative role during mitosis, partial [Podochytrium sp. JEL0797]